MQPFRIGRWGSQILPLGARQCCLVPRQTPKYSLRFQSNVTTQALSDGEGETAKRKRGRPRKLDTPAPSPAATPLHSSMIPPAAALESEPVSDTRPPVSAQMPTTPPSARLPPSFTRPSPTLDTATTFSHQPSVSISPPLEQLPSPPVSAAAKSAKLSSLHARLSLPSRVPIETLARTLVDKTADSDPRFNNSSLAALGNDLLGYYMGEHLLCNYPRLPMAVLWASQHAYVGPSALAAVAEDWGAEVAAEPGGEVNPGLLQFRRMLPGTPFAIQNAAKMRESMAMQPPTATISSIPQLTTGKPVTTLESASAEFVRALFAAIYLHTGAASTHAFFKAHILSRHLDIASLFTFTQPTRDLSRLCAREGFDSPVARVISETGRLSRSPVFVVGVFSGRDKLGEGVGASLNEARFKAAVKALKGWYLYSPNTGNEIMVPSMMEGEIGRERTWKPAHIDDGEVVV